MIYSFNEIINRKNTDSIKYDFAVRRGKPEDILPLWVADMDFPAPKAVIDALMAKSSHGIFGYSDTREDYYKILSNWFRSSFGWEIKSEWTMQTPSVVYAICAAIRAFTDYGDSILIQEPVYYPFAESINANGRRLTVNQLVYSEGKYTIDFEDFEKKIAENDVKLFVLCSPHNPVGRVWSRDELVQIGNICIKYDVLVVSDEIHQDFVYPAYCHHVFAGLKPEFEDISVTCTSPSKTFNLAGLQISNIFIPNKDLRKRFDLEMIRTGYSQPNLMGITACKAAYGYGREWLNNLKEFLVQNLSFVRDFIKSDLPGIKLVEPQGTYLLWLDFKALRLSDDELNDRIVKKAGLWLDSGIMFGSGGEGFQRINMACPNAILEKALEKLKAIY